MRGFLVVDTETSGLSTKDGRVIEVAAVALSPDGTVEYEWDSLLDPGTGNVGRSDLHGIRRQDVAGAPVFADVAPRLLSDLAGRALVAHNASFDVRFLTAELERAGAPLPGPMPSICTMKSLPKLMPQLPDKKLATACRHLGIPLINAHAALADTRATAVLFTWLLRHTDAAKLWAPSISAVATYQWPQIPFANPEAMFRSRALR